MQIFKQECGAYRTNCYVISKNGSEIIVDPGEGAFGFVLSMAQNPLAVINTHGHFDHIFDDSRLKKYFDIDVYIHKGDKFMLENDVFGMGYETFNDAVCIGGEKFDDVNLKIGDFSVSFMHFPGHTPGCSMVRIDDIIFSGDFLFKDNIGRYDFPYSNALDMIKSIEKCLKMQGDFTLYPGHGEQTALKAEHRNLSSLLKRISPLG